MLVHIDVSGLCKAVEHINKEHCYDFELKAHWDTPKRWKIIRAYYETVSEAICRGEKVDPYELGLADYLTPIEYAVWCEIRMYGLPFYMQYPVGRRFVDFGDPRRKIAIEVDGAAYHTPEQDAKKDAELNACGWQVMRITGRQAFKTQDVLKHLAEFYGRKPLSEADESRDYQEFTGD